MSYSSALPWIKVGIIIFTVLIPIPYTLLKIREDKSTDSEGREPPILDARKVTDNRTSTDSLMPLYGSSKSLVGEAI